ncbi:amidase [Ruegeria sp. HKCCD4332]|uniref:amidase n=1 Tax=Ruegeria sp. HKCCD4332 TaxID=2683021 RepID=UPI001490CB59|nr:amidase family protein [Ruegeria sp. HKCCD4332]NOD76439.1 twin-arginine translocation signal domain-containing protein [Ruegeria sp. HKCCD4332]
MFVVDHEPEADPLAFPKKSLTRRNFLGTVGATGALLGSVSLSSTSVFAGTRQLDDLVEYDAVGLAQLVKTKEISAVELVERVIRRIEALNPIVNCVATPTFDRALEKAREVSPDTFFAGVPTMLKDMVDVGGVRRTDGSRLWATNIPQKSVAYVEVLEASGLNMIGTTVAPEFANGLDSELYGMAINPWNLEYSCNASSSGAACAVAAGIVPLVHGTDGGGSNRLPASACNVIGFKPSRGRMMSGEQDGGHDTFKTNGPICRTVRDAAALIDVCEDKAGPFPPIGFIEGPSKRRLKVAYARMGTKGVEPVAAIVRAQDAVAELLRELGHEVTVIEHPIDGAEYLRMFRYAFLPKFAPLLSLARGTSGQTSLDTGLLSNWTATTMLEGQSYSPEQRQEGLDYFNDISAKFAAVFANHDVIFSATSPSETLKRNTVSHRDDFAFKAHLLENLLALTSPVNAVGDCAISLPLSFSSETNMPVGSMFHAAAGNDATLVELSYELEQARPWKDNWAPYSAKFIPV